MFEIYKKKYNIKVDNLKGSMMYIEIKNYKILQSKKDNIMVSFEIRTKHIDTITLCSFFYYEEKKALIIDYWVGEVKSFSYFIKDISKEMVDLIKKQDIILISEENKESSVVIMNAEDNFNYECVNDKHLDKT